MVSEGSRQTLVCTECRRSVSVTPEFTSFGFQRFTCPSCREAVLYPLLAERRRGHQIAMPLILVATLIGLWFAKPLVPGVVFIANAFVLLRDRALVRAVKAASEPL